MGVTFGENAVIAAGVGEYARPSATACTVHLGLLRTSARARTAGFATLFTDLGRKLELCAAHVQPCDAIGQTSAESYSRECEAGRILRPTARTAARREFSSLMQESPLNLGVRLRRRRRLGVVLAFLWFALRSARGARPAPRPSLFRGGRAIAATAC